VLWTTNAFEIAAREQCIDEVIADSFPASDPPSWTPAIARLSPSGPDDLHARNTGTAMLKQGDLLPHFSVTDLAGQRVDYASIWQRKNLVLVMLSDAGRSSHAYAEQLMAQARGSKQGDIAWLVTGDHIAGLPSPVAIVADRWGELMLVAVRLQRSQLPAPEELVEWVDFVRHRCPECEGEAW